jgi:hypothetical protein
MVEEQSSGIHATGNSIGAVWQNSGWYESTYKVEVCNEFLHAVLMETKQWMWGLWGSEWCVSAVRQWCERQATWPNSGCEHSEAVSDVFRQCDSDVRDRPHSRWPCEAVSSCDKERLNQIIH